MNQMPKKESGGAAIRAFSLVFLLVEGAPIRARLRLYPQNKKLLISR
jgi:hypothetical protein